MAAPIPRSLGSRLRRLLLFVAIVWGIGTSFVAVEMVAVNGGDLLRSYPAVFGDVALPSSVTSSTSCVVRADEAGERPAGQDNGDGPASAWLLGISLGRDALLRQYASTKTQFLEQLGEVRRELAQNLGVPPPAVFHVQQVANANIEFVAAVENDPAGTAHRLAVTMSPRACELFKLGALWGYSEMIRPSLPGERAVLAVEIRYHALRAEVPAPLWTPMLERVPENALSRDIITQTTALTNALTAYLMRPAAAPPKGP